MLSTLFSAYLCVNQQAICRDITTYYFKNYTNIPTYEIVIDNFIKQNVNQKVIYYFEKTSPYLAMVAAQQVVIKIEF